MMQNSERLSQQVYLMYYKNIRSRKWYVHVICHCPTKLGSCYSDFTICNIYTDEDR